MARQPAAPDASSDSGMPAQSPAAHVRFGSRTARQPLQNREPFHSRLPGPLQPPVRPRSHLSRDYRPRVVMVVTDVCMSLTGNASLGASPFVMR